MDYFTSIDLTDVKGVLIDIDDTLFDFEKYHMVAVTACAERFIDGKPDISTAAFINIYAAHRNSVVERLYSQGTCRSRLLVFQSMFEAMGYANAYIHAAEYEKLYWDSFIGNIKVYPPAMAFLKQCAELSLPVCAVTDMQAGVQTRKLEALKISQYIKYMVTSEETGIEKPAPAMFRFALRKIGLSVKDVIMIGDNKAKDIEGAEAIGIRAYYVKATS